MPTTMVRDRQKLILHIGHHKTGSSYIQSSLALSAVRLREAGIEYPELEPFTRAKRGGISSGNLVDDETLVQTITDEARRYSKTSQLLFSREQLFSRIAKDGTTLATLQKSFDLTVVLFTREFLAQAISTHGQRVKRNGSTAPLGTYLAEGNMPHLVLQVLQAIERAGCRLKVFNYSRHSHHLLHVFAGAIGVAPETLVLPPVARMNRSLDEAELALARRFNAVLGTDSSPLVADALCERLPLHCAGPPRIARQDYEAYRAWVAPLEAAINSLLPPSERYTVDEPVLIEDGNREPDRVMGISEAQMDVLARSLGGGDSPAEEIAVRTNPSANPGITSGSSFIGWQALAPAVELSLFAEGHDRPTAHAPSRGALAAF